MKSSLNYYNKLYLKWIEIIKLKNLLKSTVDSAMIFESQTKDKLNLGLVENDGYQNAKYSLLTYQEQYRTILYNYENIKNELNLFLDIENFEPDNNTTDNVLLKIFSKEYKEISFNDTRNFLILNLNKENLESLKKVKENQSLPHLDFFGKADIKFNSLLNVDDDYSSKNSDPSIDFQVGLQFNYPLIGLNTKSAKKEINLSIDLLLKEYEITENTYKKNVNTLTNSQLYLKQVIDYKNQSLDTLRKRAMIEETKFKQGRITLKELIDTRNLIINGQISIIQTQTNIILNDIDYDYITK
ncbi:MAG: hypothetical protein A2355_10490 [Spirochaetes bacterium RIFOXYB1_FULL_32_8]|nr:MAG: hypothetical protein A2355_10490 [Spirochaetes bacterium RIFOXYB1_FULL_32_8]